MAQRTGLLPTELALEALSQRLESLVNPAIFSYYSRLKRVKDYVEGNLRLPISLGDAAETANLERKYFSTFFHARVGLTFKQWLTLQRVRTALRIMRENDESISRVAYRSGFRDIRTFERAFKRVTGFTPTEFRASVRPH